jgi:hypothetical protein
LERLAETGRHDATMALLADHVAVRLARLVDELWDGPVSDALDAIDRLLPMRRFVFDWCVARRDATRAEALVMPFTRLLPSTFASAFDGVDRLVQLVDPEDRSRVELLGLLALHHLYRQEFREAKSLVNELAGAAGSLEQLTPAIANVVHFVVGVVGDDDLAQRIAHLRFPGNFGRFFAAMAYSQLAQRDSDAGASLVDEILAESALMPTRFGRSTVLVTAAFAAEFTDSDRVLELLDRSLDEAPEGSSLRMSAIVLRAGAHLRRGDLEEALASSAQALEMARTLGERSMLVPLLALHALVLQRLDRPGDAARVAGAAPRRWLLFFRREGDALNAWLDSRYSPDELHALRAEGRAMEIDDLLALAPAALAAVTDVRSAHAAQAGCDRA